MDPGYRARLAGGGRLSRADVGGTGFAPRGAAPGLSGAPFSMLATRRVLIADDDLEVRSGIVDLLSPMGLEILQAESGLEVLDWLGRRARDPFDLLLLDMHMPGCSGLEVLTALRARHAAESRDDLHPIVPTIFCSGGRSPSWSAAPSRWVPSRSCASPCAPTTCAAKCCAPSTRAAPPDPPAPLSTAVQKTAGRFNPTLPTP